MLQTSGRGRYASRVNPASWPRRIGALVIDWFVALFSAAAITQTPVFGSESVGPWWPLLMFWLEVSLLTGLLGYSIGKRVTGLAVVRADESPVGALGAFIRTTLLLLVIPPLINTEQRRGLHDLAARSMVVNAR